MVSAFDQQWIGVSMRRFLGRCALLVISVPAVGLWAQMPNQPFTGTMAECDATSVCTTWNFSNNHAEARWSNGGVADLVIEQFGSSVSIRRTDTIGVGAGIRAVYVGVRNGDELTGTVSWTWPGHPSGTANWHATIQHPGPVPNTLVANGPLTTFMYPGTNYKTQLTAINDSGVAVGWFTPSVPNPVCDPVAFGGPCLSTDPNVIGINIPYAFSYSNGKFKRLGGPVAGAPNNLPVAVNNKGQVLIFHGRFTNIAGGTGYVLYDLATGTTKTVELGGLPAKGAADLVTTALVHITGMNSNGVVGGNGMVIETKGPSGIKQGYGLIIGTPNIHPMESDPDSGTSSFRSFEVLLPSCPKEDSNLQYMGKMQIAGPNDSGQMAFSCLKDAVVYDTSSGKSTAFSAADPNYLIKVTGISNNGSVVGCSAQPGKKAFIFRAGQFSLLPLPDEPGCALGVNFKGQVVGFSGDKAFIYTPQ